METCKCCGQPLPKDDGIPYRDIIEDLNKQTGKSFRDVQATRTFIRARWLEGYRLEDFKKVHKTKTAQWNTDIKMRGFLRPSTLYQPSKFEAYLNEFVDTPIPNNQDGIKAHEAWVMFTQCRARSNGKLIISLPDKTQEKKIIWTFHNLGGYSKVQHLDDESLYKLFIEEYLGVREHKQDVDLRCRAAGDY